jgi:hypothetical protein
VRYKLYGDNNKKEPTANNSKGKHINPDKLYADGIKKRQVRGEIIKGASWMEGNSYTMLPVDKVERCTFRIKIYFKKKEGFYYLSRHGLGYEHKGHSKNVNVKTSVAHT